MAKATRGRTQPQSHRPRQVHNPSTRLSNMSTGGKVALTIGGLIVGTTILVVGIPLIVIAVAARKADERLDEQLPSAGGF